MELEGSWEGAGRGEVGGRTVEKKKSTQTCREGDSEERARRW